MAIDFYKKPSAEKLQKMGAATNWQGHSRHNLVHGRLAEQALLNFCRLFRPPWSCLRAQSSRLGAPQMAEKGLHLLFCQGMQLQLGTSRCEYPTNWCGYCSWSTFNLPRLRLKLSLHAISCQKHTCSKVSPRGLQGGNGAATFAWQPYP